MIFQNPELQRYLWLNFSPFRLWMPPVMVALLMILSERLPFTGSGMPDFFIFLFVIVVFFKGSSESGNAFKKEIDNKTWDFQRTSPIPPLQLVIGKAFGSASYSWYIGFCCLIGVYISHIAFDETGPIFLKLATLVAGGVLGHMAAFLAGILSQRSGLIWGIIVSITSWQMAQDRPFTSDVFWFSTKIDWDIFFCASLLFWGFWLFRSSVGMMRERMQYTNIPLDWLLFLLTTGAYFAGLGAEDRAMWSYSLIFGLSMLGYTYFAFLFEARNLTRYKRFFRGYQQSNNQVMLENLPRWAVSLALAVTALIVFQFVLPDKAADKALPHIFPFFLTFVLFVCRDGLVFHIILIGRSAKHSGFALIVFYLLAYVMLPALVGVEWVPDVENIFRKGGTDNFSLALGFFYPSPHKNLVIAVLPVLFECTVCLYLLKSRLQKLSSGA